MVTTNLHRPVYEISIAEIKKYLDAELDDITSGNAKFLSVEEAEQQLENSSEIEAGLEDVKANRITYINPKNIWEGIK
ncbi:MAG: hypothetical protein WCI31_16900 [Prolixibacteraceae bacterium]